MIKRMKMIYRKKLEGSQKKWLNVRQAEQAEHFNKMIG
jgi:hypothetical protein